MTTHIALLRGINVGGKTSVAMADLRALLSDLGLGEPRSLLQSGNLVFDSDKTPAALEKLLESAAQKQLELGADFLVRSATQWRAIVDGNPFAKEAKSDPSHLVVMLLKKAPPTKSVAALTAAIKDREVLEAVGRHLYIVYPDGIGRSRLTGTLIESKLGTRGTARNWNTVTKLADLVNAE